MNKQNKTRLSLGDQMMNSEFDTNALYVFSKQAQIAQDQDMLDSVESDLQRTKTHLKFVQMNYIETESKRRFLDAIQSLTQDGEGFDAALDDLVKDAEAQVATMKQEVKQARAKKEISKDAFIKSIEPCVQLVQQAKQKQAEYELDFERLHKFLGDFETQKHNLMHEEDVQETSEPTVQPATTAQQTVVPLTDAQFLQQMNDTLSFLTGVKVLEVIAISAKNKIVKLKLAKHIVTVWYDKPTVPNASWSISVVEVLPDKQMTPFDPTAPIIVNQTKEIEMLARQSNDLGLLVRELQHRLYTTITA